MNAAVVLLGGLVLIGAAGGGSDTGAPAGTAPDQGRAVAGVGAMADYEQMATLVAEAGFPRHHHDDLVAVFQAESSGRVSVVSAPNSNGTRDYCLAQINSVHGYDPHRLTTDLGYCLRAAREVYDLQGLGAWSTYNNGAYLDYAGEARTAVGS